MIWERLGLHLAGFGGGFGRHLKLLGPLGSILEVFFSCLYLGCSSKVVLEASGVDFGLILEGLERLEGGFGEGLGRIFACFGLFWLALAALAACAFRSIATQVVCPVYTP